MSQKSNKALVIIVAYQGLEYLKTCLPTVLKALAEKQEYQVLLIDNASTDQTVHYVKQHHPSVEIIALEYNQGFAAGNNVGYRYACDHGFEYVYLLNQDTEVEPDFLDSVVQVADADMSIGAVQSKLLLFNDKTKINSIGNELHYLGFGYAGGHKTSDKRLSIREIAYPSGAGVLVRVSALTTKNIFQESFFAYHEDTDLGISLWLSNYRVVCQPESIVYHKYEFSRSIKKYYWMERNRFIIILQTYRLPTLLLILPAFILMELGLLVFAIKGGWWRQKIQAWLYILSPLNWSTIYKVRRLRQKNRTKGDRVLFHLMTGEILFQDMRSVILEKIANPFFNLYFLILKKIIKW